MQIKITILFMMEHDQNQKKMEQNPKKGIPFAFYYKDGTYKEIYNYSINNKVKEYSKKPKIVLHLKSGNKP